jgi:hypothetical protein
MRPDVREDFDWGRNFLPHLREIVAHNLIAEAPAEEDMQRNTDLIVLKLNAIRIACRVRRHQYMGPYGDEFTIRARRPSGGSELGKLIEGWGDYMVYGFAPAGDCGPYLDRWFLGDLRVFRSWFTRQSLRQSGAAGVEKKNGDGSSTFRAFRVADLPGEFVVASSRLHAEAA